MGDYPCSIHEGSDLRLNLIEKCAPFTPPACRIRHLPRRFCVFCGTKSTANGVERHLSQSQYFRDPQISFELVSICSRIALAIQFRALALRQRLAPSYCTRIASFLPNLRRVRPHIEPDHAHCLCLFHCRQEWFDFWDDDRFYLWELFVLVFSGVSLLEAWSWVLRKKPLSRKALKARLE